MADRGAEVAAAKAAIMAMLRESPRPTQRMIALATGVSQGYVAKINKCDFSRMSDGVRRIVEYSKMSFAERADAARRIAGAASRVSTSVQRLAARDPLLAEALADFVERITDQKLD